MDVNIGQRAPVRAACMLWGVRFNRLFVTSESNPGSHWCVVAVRASLFYIDPQTCRSCLSMWMPSANVEASFKASIFFPIPSVFLPPEVGSCRKLCRETWAKASRLCAAISSCCISVSGAHKFSKFPTSRAKIWRWHSRNIIDLKGRYRCGSCTRTVHRSVWNLAWPIESVLCGFLPNFTVYSVSLPCLGQENGRIDPPTPE